MTRMNLSIIIASYDGYKKVQKLLNSILANDYIPSEIIIVCYRDQYNKYFFNCTNYSKAIRA